MYQFQFEYTLEDYEMLSRLASKTFRKGSMLIRRGIYAIMAILYFVGAALGFFLQNWIIVAVFTAGGIFFGVMTIFWHPLIARRTKKAGLKGMGVLNVRLEEDGIRSHHQKGELFTPYDAIVDAFHFRGYYYMALDNRQVILLPEHALVEGDPATLKAFLEAKLQKEVKEIP